MQPEVTAFFDQATNTVTYVVADAGSCVVVDSVLDYDAPSGRTSTASADKVIDFIEQNGLSLKLILETHVHADHLTAAPYIRSRLGGQIGISAHITAVQDVFRDVFNIDDVVPDGAQFDTLLNDGDEFEVGNISGRVMHTPGHTPACNTYIIGDAVFVGDTVFMPDFGTARADFPGGDAALLYRSIQKILALPAQSRLFMCHDYKVPGRDRFAWESTVAEQREQNVHIHDGVSEEEFVRFRNGRDAELGMPKLIIPSIQVNIRAGEFPAPESNGVSYLKIPVNKL
ncbi:MAG: MBL fold metallo-hydrolase [Gammaproteobacteria bacterium]|nr:MAG: MBL fold metallo-hydrolase [Gammaproteobacteria bacterium]